MLTRKYILQLQDTTTDRNELQQVMYTFSPRMDGCDISSSSSERIGSEMVYYCAAAAAAVCGGDCCILVCLNMCCAIS